MDAHAALRDGTALLRYRLPHQDLIQRLHAVYSSNVVDYIRVVKVKAHLGEESDDEELENLIAEMQSCQKGRIAALRSKTTTRAQN